MFEQKKKMKEEKIFVCLKLSALLELLSKPMNEERDNLIIGPFQRFFEKIDEMILPAV